MKKIRRRSLFKFFTKVFVLSFPTQFFNSGVIFSFGTSKKKIKEGIKRFEGKILINNSIISKNDFPKKMPKNSII